MIFHVVKDFTAWMVLVPWTDIRFTKSSGYETASASLQEQRNYSIFMTFALIRDSYMKLFSKVARGSLQYIQLLVIADRHLLLDFSHGSLLFNYPSKLSAFSLPCPVAH